MKNTKPAHLKKLSIRTDKPVNELTKSDEQKVLEDLHTAFMGSGCYLETLFTDSMIHYCQDQIRDDVMPDIFSSLINNSSRELDLEYKLRKANEVIEGLRAELDRVRDRAQFFENMANNLEVREAKQSVVISRFQDALKDLLAV